MAFNAKVSARTRAANQILNSADLLGVYTSKGGLAKDLQRIASEGAKAEAFNLAQSQSQGATQASTLQIHQAFIDLQREYTAVMAVVQAVTNDFETEGTDADTLAALKKILVNEAQVTIQTDSTGKKRASVSTSQEALRAEIQKDASALLALPAAQPSLAERQVTAVRLAKLRDDASALSGKLSDRAVRKGQKKAATAAEQNAVKQQQAAWQAAYRILAQAAADSPSIKVLLKEAAEAKG